MNKTERQIIKLVAEIIDRETTEEVTYGALVQDVEDNALVQRLLELSQEGSS